MHGQPLSAHLGACAGARDGCRVLKLLLLLLRLLLRRGRKAKRAEK